MRAKRADEHRCTLCGQPLPEGETRKSCDACRARRKAYYMRRQDRSEYYSRMTKARYARNSAEHRCVWCGKPLPDGHPVKRCDACRAKGHEQYMGRKQARIADRLLWEFFKGDDWQKLADVVVEAAKILKEGK